MRSATAPRPSAASSPTASAEARPAPLALYVHWPFCKAKCPYCDFNSHVRETVDQERWRKALLAEIDSAAADLPGRPLSSIFFGGGTPSLMDPVTAEALIGRATAHWKAEPELEITLEANPTSVEAGRLADFRAAGVNRVSLGVQALDDTALGFLGRNHSAAEALAAVDLAARLFPRYSFDLIYARPGQTPASWAEELRRALFHARDHLSVYQLTIEPGTVFHGRARRGETLTPSEATAAALYEITQEALEDASLPAYEISNHARQGAESRHNLAYWRYLDYAGVGPGAHGRITLGDAKIAMRRVRSPERWLAAVEAAGHGEEERTALSARERRDELVMMGLRLAEGVPAARIEAEAGGLPPPALDTARVRDLVEAGYLADDPATLRATPAGRQRLNAVIGYLLG